MIRAANHMEMEVVFFFMNDDVFLFRYTYSYVYHRISMAPEATLLNPATNCFTSPSNCLPLLDDTTSSSCSRVKNNRPVGVHADRPGYEKLE